MFIGTNHVVVISCWRHGFYLHLYLGAARAPDIPFHVHERQFRRLVTVTKDPKQLAALLAREVPDEVDFD